VAFDVVLCSLAVHHLPNDARADAFAEMRRVLKPEGRALIVEFSRERGVWALLHPVALLHARRSPRILDEAVALMKRAGFASVATGPLGFRGLGYALAQRRASRGDESTVPKPRTSSDKAPVSPNNSMQRTALPLMRNVMRKRGSRKIICDY